MLEKISNYLQKDIVLKILSLLIGVIAFLIITQAGSPGWRDIFFQSEVITDVQVNSKKNKDHYITGLPDKMPIIISGNENQLIAARNQQSAMSVTIDVSKYEPGKYTIGPENMIFNVEGGGSATSVIKEYSIDIQKLATQDYPVKLSYSDSKLTTGFTFSNPTLSSNSISITGGSETLDKIANVQALVDINSIDPSNGSSQAKLNAKVIAYDKKGIPIENVELEKDEIQVEIEYKSEAKEIPISYEFIGQKDLYVSDVCPINSQELCNNNKEVTVKVFGDNQKIKEITERGELVYSIDISKIDQNQGEVEGVALLSNGVFVEGGSTMKFNVKLEQGKSKKITDVSVQTQGLSPKFAIKAVSARDGKINVDVEGAKSIIDGYTDSEGNQVPGLSSSDLQAYIDLSNVDKAGSYEVPILITKTKPFSFKLDVQTIKIEIVEA